MSDEVLPTLDQGNVSGASAKFTVIEGRAKGRRYKVDKTATIGRSPEATIMLEDAEVSRLHARVSRTSASTFEVVDLDSRNGTFVNGERIRAPRDLRYGDKIRLGPYAVLEYYGFDAAEEQIIQRERFEAIGRLTIGIAHDLNNVLATMDAGTAFLRELPHSSRMDHTDVRECLADMSLASIRAAELTRAILSFARGSEREYCPVDISSLVLEVTRMLRHTLDRRINLVPSVDAGIYVHGNRSELHQALLNLCLNARDAMPNGGTMNLGVQRHGASMSGERDDQRPMAVVSVRDSGIGMDAVTLSRIFEPFFTTKRDGRGYGLGLATVREIVTMHGGQIFVDSKPSSGTEFTLLLPALEATTLDLPETEQRDLDLTLRPPAIFRVLLVDDEEIVRRSMARRMRQTGFEVLEASDGVHALDTLERQVVDLVVLDMDMPRLNGEETFISLRRQHCQAKVAFMSGYTDPAQSARLRAMGAVAVLEKPCDLDTLLAVVHAVRTKPAVDVTINDELETLTRPQ